MDTPAPQSLLTDLARLHLRATASPLPADPAVMGWQMQTAAVTGLAARLLHALAAVDPQQAAALADWYAGPFGEGPHPASHLPWLDRHVARPAGASIDQWLEDAQQTRAAENAPHAQLFADEMPDTWVRAVADAIAHHGHQIADAHESAIVIRLTPQQRRTLHAETEPYLVISWRGDNTGTGALDWGISPDGTHTTHPQPLTDTTHPAEVAHTVDRLLTTGQPDA